MKYYTVRDKKTKEPSRLAESTMSLWDSVELAEYALSVYCYPQTDEVVALRVEPTEPCDWCSGELFEVEDDYFVKYYEKEKKFMFARDFGGGILGINMVYLPCKLCPNCGRRLKDDNE